MRWTVSEARKHLSELLEGVQTEPQEIMHRNRPVAAVVDMATFQEFREWRERRARRPSEWFDELRDLCAQEDCEIPVPQRLNRVLDLPD